MRPRVPTCPPGCPPPPRLSRCAPARPRRAGVVRDLRIRSHRQRRKRLRRPAGRLPPLRPHHRGQLQPGRRIPAATRRPLHRRRPPRPPPRPAAGADRKPDRRQPAARRPSSTPRAPRPSKPSLSGESCPDHSQIGVVTVRTSPRRRRHAHLRRLQPRAAAGRPFRARLHPLRRADRLRPHTSANRAANTASPSNAANLPQLVDLDGLKLTLWGAPWVASHDAERGNCLNEAEPAAFFAKMLGRRRSQRIPAPRLPDPAHLLRGAARLHRRAPTPGSSRPGASSAVVQPLQPGRPAEARRLRRGPLPAAALRRSLANPRASSADGFDFNSTPTSRRPTAAANGSPPRRSKKAVVALPEGMTINPSVGAGLGVCTAGQYAAETVASAAGRGLPERLEDRRLHGPEPALRRSRSPARSSSPSPCRTPSTR